MPLKTSVLRKRHVHGAGKVPRLAGRSCLPAKATRRWKDIFFSLRLVICSRNRRTVVGSSRRSGTQRRDDATKRPKDQARQRRRRRSQGDGSTNGEEEVGWGWVVASSGRPRENGEDFSRRVHRGVHPCHPGCFSSPIRARPTNDTSL